MACASAGRPMRWLGGVHREQENAVLAGLCGESVAEHRGRDAGHGFAEPFAALPSAMVSRPTVRASAKSRSSTAMVSMPCRRVWWMSRVIACRTWASRRAAGPARSMSMRSGRPTAVLVEAPYCQVSVVEVHGHHRTLCPDHHLRGFLVDAERLGCGGPCSGEVTPARPGVRVIVYETDFPPVIRAHHSCSR